METYNERITANNADLDKLTQDIEALPDYVEPKPEQEKTATANKNGAVVLTPDPGKVMSKATVTVAVPSDKKPEQTKSVSYTTNGARTVTPDPGKVLSGVSVNVDVPSKKPNIQPITITSNGTTTAPSGVDGYSPVTVNVAGGGGCGNWSKVEVESWTPAENTQMYPLPKDIAEKISLLVISRPEEGAAEMEVRLLAIEDPITRTYGVALISKLGQPADGVEYVDFKGGVGVDAPPWVEHYVPFIGGQTYTVTKCYK